MGKIEELIDELINEYKQDKLLSRGFIVEDLGAGVTEVYKEIDVVLEHLQQLKSSLPTQQDKVVVPQCVDKFFSVGNKSQKLACLVSCKYSILTCDMAEGELKQWLREISMDELLSLANDYTVEKEQLWVVRTDTGFLSFVSYSYKKPYEIETSMEREEAIEFKEKHIAEHIAAIIAGYAVPVEEEE